MKIACFLVALVLASISSLSYANWGIPAQKYKITYEYYVKNGSGWVQIGEKTYHCDGSVTQWGDTSVKPIITVSEPICN